MPDRSEYKLSDMIRTALENVKSMAEADTVIGEPIAVAGGSTVIPVSKITLGFTSGGLDFLSKNAPEKPANFGGVNGVGMNIIPLGFLVIDQNGFVTLLTFENKQNDIVGTISGLIDRAPEMFERIKSMFKKKPAKDSHSDAGNNPDADVK